MIHCLGQGRMMGDSALHPLAVQRWSTGGCPQVPVEASSPGRILLRRRERSTAGSLPTAPNRDVPSSDDAGQGQWIGASFGL